MLLSFFGHVAVCNPKFCRCMLMYTRYTQMQMCVCRLLGFFHSSIVWFSAECFPWAWLGWGRNCHGTWVEKIGHKFSVCSLDVDCRSYRWDTQFRKYRRRFFWFVSACLVDAFCSDFIFRLYCRLLLFNLNMILKHWIFLKDSIGIYPLPKRSTRIFVYPTITGSIVVVVPPIDLRSLPFL